MTITNNSTHSQNIGKMYYTYFRLELYSRTEKYKTFNNFHVAFNEKEQIKSLQ